jgi:branched-chain amino acid transport system ATP-binding protein
MVGPNGAGKTTMLAMVGGDVRPDSGTITFDEKVVTHLPATQRARLGLARTYQIPRPFVGLTVFEHALLAAQQAGGFRGSEAKMHAVHAVEQCGMKELANVAGAQLRLLDRKRLEVARAIAGSPSLVLLDEVAGGLSDNEVTELTDTRPRSHFLVGRARGARTDGDRAATGVLEWRCHNRRRNSSRSARQSFGD